MFRIAHISDLHLAPLPPLRLHELMSKRVWGRLHWVLRRRYVHRPQVLDALRADLARQQPDHLCITGDLTNLALPAEFDRARDWIAGLGLGEERLSVIPGNHDAYVPDALARGMPVWQRWMRDDEGQVGFPFRHRRGPVTIVGLSSAHATPPGFAAGWLDRAQLARLTALLEELRYKDTVRILLIHHPPQESGAPARSALWGRRRLRALLQRHPVDLVLHGHAHRPLAGTLAGRAGPIPVRGAGSASRDTDDGNPAHYQLIGIERPGGGGKWRIEIRHRRYDRDRGGFVNAGAESIGAP